MILTSNYLSYILFCCKFHRNKLYPSGQIELNVMELMDILSQRKGIFSV